MVPVSASLSQAELSSTIVGSYRYGTAYKTVTAQEVLESSSGIGAAQTSDGSYEAPTADMVLAYIRNQILNAVVADYGIQVSDADVSAYAIDVFGTDDMTSVAAALGTDETAARQAVEEAAGVRALRLQLVGEDNVPLAPSYPTDGNTELANASYAAYIISLLGSHWDATYQTWADTDNDYYAALSSMTFAYGSANYEAAEAAYAVAVRLYQQGSGTASQRWEELVNGYLDDASIVIGTLRV